MRVTEQQLAELIIHLLDRDFERYPWPSKGDLPFEQAMQRARELTKQCVYCGASLRGSGVSYGAGTGGGQRACCYLCHTTRAVLNITDVYENHLHRG